MSGLEWPPALPERQTAPPVVAGEIPDGPLEVDPLARLRASVTERARDLDLTPHRVLESLCSGGQTEAVAQRYGVTVADVARLSAQLRREAAPTMRRGHPDGAWRWVAVAAPLIAATLGGVGALVLLAQCGGAA